MRPRSRAHGSTAVAVLAGLLIAAPACPARAAGTLTERSFVSSVDGTPQPYLEYLPDGWRTDADYPLRVELHGRGGNMASNADTLLTRAADRRGYVVAFLNGRVPWSYYIDSAALGPGERDLFDMVADVQARRRIASTSSP